ncbi:DUF5681 domain-containing protein [Erythrobacter crassostreae]|uniref:DUF5681 domain-containing protein n=1 Tax=Erythrobacter crassostreae TaxID=2828328 RepID=A0A9X1F562_9SPHN|nr:DUF5681 domain-containing protein [Erythrobacter crassostrea]MBV7259010.1 hypothetical protein [Erythrobacter crassostrea]
MSQDREEKHNADDGDDKVGFAKPPKKHRFKKGKSGNPKGRPKGSKGLKTDLKEELASKMTVKIAGQEHTGTKQRLALKALTVRAAAGELKAIVQLSSLVVNVVGVEDEDIRSERLSKQDEKLLEQLLGYSNGSSDLGEKQND